jgi:hypothetical protein
MITAMTIMGSDLQFRVELRGFEPLTPAMRNAGKRVPRTIPANRGAAHGPGGPTFMPGPPHFDNYLTHLSEIPMWQDVSKK